MPRRSDAAAATLLCAGVAGTPTERTVERASALTLLEEWVQSQSLRRHCLAVEAAMRAQARARGADEELWGVCGLLHDLDYDRYPDPETGHPRMAMAELERLGYPPELIRAVGSHADYLGIARESEMERALAAVDELSGFVLACAYVRPERLEGMRAKSVRKKLGQPSFAAAVSREDIARGARELGVEQDELIESVIAALAGVAGELGLAREASADAEAG
jgi:putative nucleotidyltransferase with HDIG domain